MSFRGFELVSFVDAWSGSYLISCRWAGYLSWELLREGVRIDGGNNLDVSLDHVNR